MWLVRALALTAVMFVAAVDRFEEDIAANSTHLITWREMVENIRSATRKVQQSVETKTKELEVALEAFHVDMDSFVSSQAWRDALERQTELFKSRVNRALRQVSISPQMDASDRFTVLHHTDSLSLPRLYRILRAKDQVESMGHRYALLLHRLKSSIVSNGSSSSYVDTSDSGGSTEDHSEIDGLSTLRKLVPGNFSVHVHVHEDKDMPLLDMVAQWYETWHQRVPVQQSERESAAENESKGGQFIWVMSLELEWLGSLPQTLYQLGEGRGSVNPSFRYTPKFIGVGCVSAVVGDDGGGRKVDGNGTRSSDVDGESVTSSCGGKGRGDSNVKLGKSDNQYGLHRWLAAFSSRSLLLRRFLRWIVRFFSPLGWRKSNVVGSSSLSDSDIDYDKGKSRDFCYNDLWRVSSDLLLTASSEAKLNRTGLGAGAGRSVADLFNTMFKLGDSVDALNVGIDMGLLSARAFDRPQCSRANALAPVECKVGKATLTDWNSAKEQFGGQRLSVKSGVVFAQSGVFFRDADRLDFELSV